MPTTVIVYRLSIYFALCLTVSSLYLPLMKPGNSGRRSRLMPLVIGGGIESPSRRSQGYENLQLGKRASVYSVFSKQMTRHAHRHKTDKAFVDRMFNLFDLNRDRVIEKMEFKAVLQILGIVNHNF